MLRYLIGCPKLSQIFTAEFIPPSLPISVDGILIPPVALAKNFWLLFFSYTAHQQFSKLWSPTVEKFQNRTISNYPDTILV